MRKLLILAVAAGALATAGPAAAHTWKVHAGQPAKPPKGVPGPVFLNQFFPSVLRVHVGDKVTFASDDFHTATFLGGRDPASVPLVMPDPAGATYGGITDGVGNPFWFNGLTRFIYNAQVIQPGGSRTVSRSGFHNSGILLFQGKRGYTFTFTKAGTYKVFCQVHPFMAATIVVLPRKAKLAQTRVDRQLARSWTEAQALARQVPTEPNTVFAGVGKNVAMLRFQPAALSVPVGTTVTWVNNSPSEFHNIAFGEPTWIESFMKAVDQIPIKPGMPNQLPPVFVYGSEAPGPSLYDGANHGNGFLATPLLDALPGDPPQGAPSRTQVTFTRHGHYHYICLIHGKDMAGDIHVH